MAELVSRAMSARESHCGAPTGLKLICSAIWSGKQKPTCSSLPSSGISGISLSIMPELLKQTLNVKAYYPNSSVAPITALPSQKERVSSTHGDHRARLKPIFGGASHLALMSTDSTARESAPVTNSRVPGSHLAGVCKMLMFFPLLNRED